MWGFGVGVGVWGAGIGVCDRAIKARVKRTTVTWGLGVVWGEARSEILTPVVTCRINFPLLCMFIARGPARCPARYVYTRPYLHVDLWQLWGLRSSANGLSKLKGQSIRTRHFVKRCRGSEVTVQGQTYFGGCEAEGVCGTGGGARGQSPGRHRGAVRAGSCQKVRPRCHFGQ